MQAVNDTQESTCAPNSVASKVVAQDSANSLATCYMQLFMLPLIYRRAHRWCSVNRAASATADDYDCQGPTAVRIHQQSSSGLKFIETGHPR